MRVWFKKMPWSLNYRRPQFYRLKDGFMCNALSVVMYVSLWPNVWSRSQGE